jgi:signal transduction histidine kinase
LATRADFAARVLEFGNKVIAIAPSYRNLAKDCIRNSPGLPLLESDGEPLTELLTKLLDNACKFTEPGGKVTVWVYIHERSPCTQNACRKTITDTGQGIEPGQLQTIFDRLVLPRRRLGVAEAVMN